MNKIVYILIISIFLFSCQPKTATIKKYVENSSEYEGKFITLNAKAINTAYTSIDIYDKLDTNKRYYIFMDDQGYAIRYVTNKEFTLGGYYTVNGTFLMGKTGRAYLVDEGIKIIG
jgi:hypothetical protein